jgi:hypothetical protein
MTYNPETHQTNLMHDLAEAITSFHALDQAVAVLIEWGLVEADYAAEYIKELKANNA